MSVLQQRIINEDYLLPEPNGLLPYGTSATPMFSPLARVEYHGLDDGQYAMAYDDLHPIYTTDPSGAPLPATAPGRWGQVAAAGRP